MDSPQSGEATQYALRVALQTMKERCQDLQKRHNTLEDENQKLRAGKNEIRPTSALTNPASVGFAAENFQLRLQLAELQCQKTQLTEQINMVSTENRKLWSRLSHMAKDQGKSSIERDNDCTQTNKDTGRNSVNGANQNLIRSKTFTQHSPNPNLRLKLINDENSTTSDTKDLSLEEVTLNVGAGEEMATVGETELGFSYLNIDDSNYIESVNISETDFQSEAKKCSDGLQDLRREALQQQQELHIALTALQLRIAKPPCPECAQKANKPEMADKSLETDESLNEVPQQSQLIATTTSHNINETATTTTTATTRINFIQEKNNADALLKTCPMCGKIYDDSITFQKFREHVETHFSLDTSDFGSMMEHDFECISNTVSNF